MIQLPFRCRVSYRNIGGNTSIVEYRLLATTATNAEKKARALARQRADYSTRGGGCTVTVLNAPPHGRE